MQDVTNLGAFPHTVGNLEDRPNLAATPMKAAFEADCETLWDKMREVIPALNDKLSKEDDYTAKQRLWYPKEYFTVTSLIDLPFQDAYDLFDAYVTDGLITRTLLGYATNATPSTGTAVADTTKPIYMYSSKPPMSTATGYSVSVTYRPILITAAIHGNEKIGTVVMLNMLKALKDGDSTMAYFFSNYAVDMIPVCNPAGFDASIGTTMDTVEQNIGRTNARGVNINRNGKCVWEDESSESGTYNYKGESALSELETQLLYTQYRAKGYMAHIDIHTERFSTATNEFCTLYAPSVGLRAAFCALTSRMYKRIKEVYGYDMLTELNGNPIAGDAPPSPQIILDSIHKDYDEEAGYIIENPRYTDGKIYPVNAQKYSTDFDVNTILLICDYLTSRKWKTYVDRTENFLRIAAGDLLPTKTGWTNGYFSSGSVVPHKQFICTKSDLTLPAGTYRLRAYKASGYVRIVMNYWTNGTGRSNWTKDDITFTLSEESTVRVAYKLLDSDDNPIVICDFRHGNDYTVSLMKIS